MHDQTVKGASWSSCCFVKWRDYIEKSSAVPSSSKFVCHQVPFIPDTSSKTFSSPLINHVFEARLWTTHEFQSMCALRITTEIPNSGEVMCFVLNMGNPRGLKCSLHSLQSGKRGDTTIQVKPGQQMYLLFPIWEQALHKHKAENYLSRQTITQPNTRAEL